MKLWKLRGRVSGAPGSPLSHLVVEVVSGPRVPEHKTVEVVPLNEVREALLAPEAIEVGAKARYERRRIPDGFAFTWDEQAEGIKQQWRSTLECDLKPLLDAAFTQPAPAHTEEKTC